MKLRNYILPALISLGAISCAVKEEEQANDAERTYLEAWMHVHHPGVGPTGSGIYIIDDQPSGSTEKVGFPAFAMVTYTATDLEGKVTSNSDEEVAKQLGDYQKSNFYGPVVWNVSDYSIYKGVEDMLKDMTVGSTRTAVIPGWLMTYSRYSTDEEYYQQSTETKAAIYKVKVCGRSEDIVKWEVDSLEKFSARYLGDADSLKYGFYYKRLSPEPVGKDTISLRKDTTIYINYTGRLLNGKAFDTTDEQTAIDNDIYSPSRSYKPVEVKMSSDSTQITMGESSLIPGFTHTLWQMRRAEKGVGVFYSKLGYGTKGNGSSIPGYSPLLFEISIVPKPVK